MVQRPNRTCRILRQTKKKKGAPAQSEKKKKIEQLIKGRE